MNTKLPQSHSGERRGVEPITKGASQRVAIITLGCGRNDVDSDNIGGVLAQGGHTLVEDTDAADVVVVNTCTFIEAAREESVETILGAGESGAKVVVTGCMAQRYGEELATAVPEAAAVVGFDQYRDLPAIVARAGDGSGRVTAPHPSGLDVRKGDERVGDGHIRDLPLITPSSGSPSFPPGVAPEAPPTAAFPVRTQPRGPWAYLKIAGGCDRVCTFCSIPSFRGRFRSRPLSELRAETEWLVRQGVREVVCVSENTTSWGKDLDGGRRSQQDLVSMFDAVEGLERARLMYLQPAEITAPLLDAMASSETVCSYYDLSLQHASAGVLNAMARSGSPERFLSLIEGIRERDPAAVFRSSFITGFPGETDEDVEILTEFIAAAGIDWAGVFTFSPEEGTAAATLPQRPSDAEARRRAGAVSDVIELVTADAADRFIGTTLDVMIDANDDTGSLGRSYREAPETDGEIRLPGVQTPPGRSISVTIAGTDGVDLVAEPVADGASPTVI